MESIIEGGDWSPVHSCSEARVSFLSGVRIGKSPLRVTFSRLNRVSVTVN